jgi:hypothetical protein
LVSGFKVSYDNEVELSYTSLILASDTSDNNITLRCFYDLQI